MSELLALADYDNIPRDVRHFGVRYVVARLISALASHPGATFSRLRVRLYGGWYEDNRPTRLAQTLAAEATSSFPAVMPVVTTSGSYRVPTQVELAYGLEIAPRHHLFATHRLRERASDIACHDPRTKGCSIGPCPMLGLFGILTAGACPEPTCALTTGDLLFRQQQKLVDSMLATDLLHSARADTQVAIVTSDDDLWPPIMAATLSGATLFHVQAKPGRRTRPHYARGAGPHYHQLEL